MTDQELQLEKETLAKIKATWSRKKFTPVFEDFYKWHTALEKKCVYCGITEVEIATLIIAGKLETKRLATRGRKLEFDRKKPELPYENLDNIVLSCYWCNNAKTDTFTHEEFKEVGKSFADIWRKRRALIV